MLEKLEAIKRRFEDVEVELSSPTAMSDMKRFAQLNKEYKELSKIVAEYHIYNNIMSNIESNKEILATEKDEEFREMAKAELDTLIHVRDKMEEDIRLMLIPSDPEDAKNAILEIRAGTGGDEASLFAGDLFRMYQRFIEKQPGWRMTLLDHNEGTAGGYKEIGVQVEGDDVYGKLKYESGVHRVQRVPATEAQGRIHTSAATVAVMPEASDVDIEINESDLRIDVYRASGAGGQHVNKTESAVRITHIPTGVVVAMQEEKSQHKNKAKAMKILKARILDAERERLDKERAADRKDQVGSGDRSERIRTYNFPQGRCTDHRINLTLYELDTVMQGLSLGKIIDALVNDDQAKKLAMLDENAAA
jgi:peptide chain release factor 1